MKRRHLQRCLNVPLGVHTKLIEEVSLTGFKLVKGSYNSATRKKKVFARFGSSNWHCLVSRHSACRLRVSSQILRAFDSAEHFFHSDFIHDSKTHQIGSSINLFILLFKDSAQIFCSSLCCFSAKSKLVLNA